MFQVYFNYTLYKNYIGIYNPSIGEIQFIDGKYRMSKLKYRGSDKVCINVPSALCTARAAPLAIVIEFIPAMAFGLITVIWVHSPPFVYFYLALYHHIITIDSQYSVDRNGACHHTTKCGSNVMISI